MEENRLKPMIPDYDQNLFNVLYEKTEGLRRKLASEIDARRFGVDYEEILAWFNVKFIYVFNKYYNTKKDTLLGYLINSLKTYKIRIIKLAYTAKYSQSIVDITEVGNYENIIIEEEAHMGTRDLFYNLCIEFMKNNLSDNAYQLLHVQLSPPPFILKRMQEEGIENINKIPSSFIADYFELGDSPRALSYIDDLKKEIKETTTKARNYFSNKQYIPI